MQKRVAILGGGVAGLSAAHELAIRGFNVTVFEQHAYLGGKARSFLLHRPKASSDGGAVGLSLSRRKTSIASKFGNPEVLYQTAGGRRPLPGEHGFRFFAAFYKHLPDTMSKIPFAHQPNGVLDNLVEAPRLEAACINGPPIRLPTHFPESVTDLRAALGGLLQIYRLIPTDELIHFFGRMLLLASSCDRRRIEEFEQIGWWDFIGASDRSETYRRYLALAVTRPLIACRAEDVSARTGGLIALRLLFDMCRPGIAVDRVLNGPTNEAWIRPWFEYLRGLGVTFKRGAKVEKINCKDRRITGVKVSYHDVDNPALGPRSGPPSENISFDYYIAALPAEVMRGLLTRELCEAEPGLNRLHELRVAWMNGIQFYLKRDIRITAGHALYLDSPWALTSISQQQFWSEDIAHTYGNGKVRGILSVDVSNWDAPGILYNKPAAECTGQEIQKEVWEQLKRHLNQSESKVLDDDDLEGAGIDRDIREHTCRGQSQHTADCLNREPLLINTVGSWNSRPEAKTRIANLFLAADYVRTSTDLATMEGANEAARRAVNWILDASGSQEPKCQLWAPDEPPVFKPLRALDDVIYRTGQSHLLDRSLTALIDQGAGLLSGLAGRSAGQEPSTIASAVTHHQKNEPPIRSQSEIGHGTRTQPGTDRAPAESRRKTKVTILGGGMSSITAAFKLTETEDLRQKYDVTIYQMGWRIGGKGASGRNRDRCNRIEEHGLHLWFGFYDNAFKLMRQCYEALGRAPCMPLATLEDAFKPCDNLIVYEKYNKRWSGWEFKLPRNSLRLGDAAEPLDFWEMTHAALRWLSLNWRSFETAHAAAAPDAVSSTHNFLGTMRSFGRLAGVVREEGDELAEGFKLLEQALGLAARRRRKRRVIRSSNNQDRSLIVELLTKFRSWLWQKHVAKTVHNQQSRRFFEIVDYVTTTITGMTNDCLLELGFEVVNDETLLDWYKRHGAYPITIDGPLVKFTYYAAFAFRDGDPAKPDCAAGVALSSMLRMLFTYKTSVTFKMQAGMGDTVFAPLYLVLKERGVKFKFFHAVTKLALTKDKRSIDEIEVIPQVDLSGREYEPLIPVRGLPCWPNQPLWEQLEGIDCKDPKVNLEHVANPFNKAPVTLKKTKDFDLVILGIPVAALPKICEQLLEDPGNPRFKMMVDNSSTIMTQAFQLWLKRSTDDGLGWNFEQNSVMTGYSDPLDTYCDMSHLICREEWQDSQSNHAKTPTPQGSTQESPLGIAYFCSALESEPGDDQSKAEQRVKENALNYLRHRIASVWPHAIQSERTSTMNWDLLLDPASAQGEARFDSQFWVANYNPSERYVLTPAGSLKYRLKADQSGYDNLYLTGDWIDNEGLNIGCIEAAVMAGMQTARAITGSSESIAGVNRWYSR